MAWIMVWLKLFMSVLIILLTNLTSKNELNREWRIKFYFNIIIWHSIMTICFIYKIYLFLYYLYDEKYKTTVRSRCTSI